MLMRQIFHQRLHNCAYVIADTIIQKLRHFYQQLGGFLSNYYLTLDTKNA
mgnify:CR=1 FL=1